MMVLNADVMVTFDLMVLDSFIGGKDSWWVCSAFAKAN
ncbi:hypothetical protein NMS_2593 [Nonlabens marinus S1-08]|uniref:Uncharacterized protein n=1 Tax=Nonlabens marinus S1-08 TaxID=1454201 RepID=W8VXV8_9FLAO|nr:hypothetical protein NMS_2593 [Nonlabens marinus S1-08]